MVEVSKDGKMSGTPDMHFLVAARDFYDEGEDGFSPKYAQYGDLLAAAERVVATLQAERDRYRVALEEMPDRFEEAANNPCTCRTDEIGCPHCNAWGAVVRDINHALSDTPTVQS